MKIKFFYSLALIAIASFASCTKDKDNGSEGGTPDNPGTPIEPTTVTIGDKAYPIVKIGAQSWTGGNYSGAGGAIFPTNPGAQYGKLYTYAEATAITPPTGWRLPTKEDYLALLQTVEAVVVDNKSTTVDAIKKLQSVEGWSSGHKGTNVSGFNAFPAGLFANNSFNALGDNTTFWTSSKTADNNPYFMTVSKAELQFYHAAVTTEKFSVRFVKAN